MTGGNSAQRASPRQMGWSSILVGGVLVLANAPAFVLVGWLFRMWDRYSVQPVLAMSLAVGLLGSLMLAALIAERARHAQQALALCENQNQHLRCLVETAADAILMVNEVGVIVSCNPAGDRMFGYSSGGLIGQLVSRILPESSQGRQGQPIEARRKDGSRFPVSLAVSKLRQSGNSIRVLIAHDLTEINQTRHAAEAASRSKHSFLARISHELRTPLGGILGMVEMLRDTPLNADQNQCLNTIQESADALLRNFDQLIEYANLEAGQVALRREPFSLRQVIRETLAPLTPLARSKGIRLEVCLVDDLPDRALGDPVRLGQAISCLVGNAVKFTQRGEVVLRVAATVQRPEPLGLRPHSPGDTRVGGSLTRVIGPPVVTLTFEISDTGIGISPDHLTRIFQPFEQADTSSTRRHGGVGLGLTLASRLLSLMGGRLEVQSHPGKGSTFYFALALETADATVRQRSVLVVLACEEEREKVKKCFIEGGIQTTAVGTGRAALTELLRAVVQGSPFGLVLIEEHLPDLSAREMFQRLRDRSDSLPLAVLVGHSETDLPLPEGVCSVLSRPVTPLQLYQVVLKAIAPEVRTLALTR
ncbi:MAG: ATP-binding protein [Thermomicrobiales bacterium]